MRLFAFPARGVNKALLLQATLCRRPPAPNRPAPRSDVDPLTFGGALHRGHWPSGPRVAGVVLTKPMRASRSFRLGPPAATTRAAAARSTARRSSTAAALLVRTEPGRRVGKACRRYALPSSRRSGPPYYYPLSKGSTASLGACNFTIVRLRKTH
jgi:hypothetical protein